MEELITNLRENFLNKICTVLTDPVSFPFKDAIQHSQYFTGKIVDINIYGIWLKHLHVDTYAFYTFPVRGIVEEQLIPNSDPRADKIKEELHKKEMSNSPFIPVEALSKMIKKN